MASAAHRCAAEHRLRITGLDQLHLIFSIHLTTSVEYDQSKLTEIKLFVLKSNIIYCSIVFANRIESTNFIKYLYKVQFNVKTSSRRLKQIPAKGTNTKSTA
jgi:hypothetical protein